jgi:universal stress protein A
MMKRILVPTDFSAHSLEALKQAVKYTNTVRGELLLLHVVEEEPLRWYAVDGLPAAPSSRIDPTGQLILSQKPQKLVHRDLCAEAEWRLAALLPPQHDRFRIEVTVGNAADEIVRVAREQKADLIIMGTQGRKGLRRWLRRGVADQVRSMAPAVVMTVEPHRLCLDRFPSYEQGEAQHVEDGNAPGAREAWESIVPLTSPADMASEVRAGARPEAAHEGAATPKRPQRAGRWRRRAVGKRSETAADRAASR